MKRLTILAVALAVLTASASLDAQIGGLLKKKAGEVIGKKPEPAKPAPAPEPAAPAPATTPGSPAATTPAAAAAPAPAKSNLSPLDPAALPVKESATQVLRGRLSERGNGDWNQLPYIPATATAAAYALNDAARATLVETVGAALKTLVMSSGYLTEHDAFIKNEHQGIDHGLKGVVGMDEAVKKNDLKTIEKLQTEMMVAVTVDQVKVYPADMLKTEFTEELAKWKRYAADPKNSGRIKYQKMVAKAQTIESLSPKDEKFVRGYTVIKSIDNDGPDTEDAVYAMHARFKQEQEQAKYDAHSLKRQLKEQLTNFIAIASKVNFNAPTVEKNKKTMFVNAADEKQGAIWKGCFRAGQPATAAAIKFAKTWLAEL